MAIVGGATVLVVNHEVFGANRYTQQIIQKVRTSLPDTAEAFDQIPTKEELNNSMVETWNSGFDPVSSRKTHAHRTILGVQTSFHWLVDAPSHTRQLFNSLSEKIKG